MLSPILLLWVRVVWATACGNGLCETGEPCVSAACSGQGECRADCPVQGTRCAPTGNQTQQVSCAVKPHARYEGAPAMKPWLPKCAMHLVPRGSPVVAAVLGLGR
jgi:hypothetical protein